MYEPVSPVELRDLYQFSELPETGAARLSSYSGAVRTARLFRSSGVTGSRTLGDAPQCSRIEDCQQTITNIN